MRNDEKTYGKASNSYGKIGKLVVNHQIPMRKGEHQIPIRKDEKPMVNHQIPMREREETTQKPSDSYGKRLDN